ALSRRPTGIPPKLILTSKGPSANQSALHSNLSPPHSDRRFPELPSQLTQYLHLPHCFLQLPRRSLHLPRRSLHLPCRSPFLPPLTERKCRIKSAGCRQIPFPPVLPLPASRQRSLPGQ